jgi:hypothetical protein
MTSGKGGGAALRQELVIDPLAHIDRAIEEKCPDI